MTAFQDISHPNLQKLYAHGTIHNSRENINQLALFFERPQGVRLSDILRQGKYFSESQVMNNFLKPISEALRTLGDHDVWHSRLNPNNIFVGDKIVIGECASEPPGVSQDHIYEPIERAMTEPLCKGSATSRSVTYALGILSYELLYGLRNLRTLEKAPYIQAVLKVGIYHLLVTKKEPSNLFADFFRGALLESKLEAWQLPQVRTWLEGKRYNLIHPSLPGEASRPFNFGGDDYDNCRALAEAIHQRWHVAGRELRTSRIDRWLEMSVHRNDLAEYAERLLSTSGGTRPSNEKANNEFIARMIIMLDPTGPIRQRGVALHVDGLGATLAHYLGHHMHQELEWLIQVVESDLPTFWSEMTDIEKTQETSSTLWLLQRVRRYLRQTRIGFGIERALYDLNPNLPCQSELLKPYHAVTLEEALHRLDALAKTHASDTSLLDRHLAGFLASKADITKEIKFPKLGDLPLIANNKELTILRIINIAQDKINKPKLVGLSTWAAIRLEQMINSIHSRDLQRTMKKQLKKAAATGRVSYVLAVLAENESARHDHTYFSRASVLYQHYDKKIDGLRNEERVNRIAKDLGGRISMFIAYCILGITITILVDQYNISFR